MHSIASDRKPKTSSTPARSARIYYAPNGSATLLDAIRQHNDPNTDYYITVDGPAAHKNLLRQIDAYRNVMIAPNVHPVVEFNLAAWKNLPGTWFEKGVQFRKMMAQAGIPDEMWGINEAGSGVRLKGVARRHLVNLVRGLYRGGNTQHRSQGIIFQQGPGYEQGLQQWQGDRHFWGALKNRVRYYMNEAYASPHAFDAWQRQRQIHYLMGATQGLGKFHPLQRLYAPMMSAYWGAQGGYGNGQVPLSDMQHFVQHQTDLLKRQGLNTYGFAWNEHPAVPDLQNLPALASSLVTY